MTTSNSTRDPLQHVNGQAPRTVHTIRDVSAPSQPEPFYQHYQEGTPIAMDLGSHSFKVGLTTELDPNNVFPATIARYRERKQQKTLTIAGNDVYRDPSIRSSVKSPFDGPLITNWEYMEGLLDYSFEHLGVNSSNGSLNNPLIITEPVACPFSQRKNMYELVFETYQAPKVTFGIDSLFSFHANSSSHNASGLVIGAGHELTHVIPVIEGRGILLHAKRIDWGGDQGQQYLSRLLALKYPYYPTRLTNHQTTYMFQDYCYALNNYNDEIKSYLDLEFLEQHDVALLVPVEINPFPEKKKSDEEIARLSQKRKEQGMRLKEQAQQKRQEKLEQKKQELEYYTNLKPQLAEMGERDANAKLIEEGFEDADDFEKYLISLDKTVNKPLTNNIDEEERVDPATAWLLVDIPDDQLTEDQVKEKRKQKLMKGNYDARERAKEMKRLEDEAEQKKQQADDEWRLRDLEDWCSAKRLEIANLVERYKEHTKLLESIKDRKSTAAQQRMKNIADMANDANGSTNAASRKRRRNAAATIDNDPNDTFGANDDDWSIYQNVNSKSVEQEQARIMEAIELIEADMLIHDPNFEAQDTFAASQTFDWKLLILHKFLHGPRENIIHKLQAEGMDPDELASHPEIIKKNHELHMNVERIRVPEILFHPSMAGIDQAGISELLRDLLLHRLDGNLTAGGQLYSLLQDVFVTGGVSNLPNFAQRIAIDLKSCLPTGAPLYVRKASDPILDAWHGMRKWAQSGANRDSYVTRKEYEEYGPEYIKEHNLGNVCLR